MLDTVRHYAQERLVESGDDAQTRSRHLAFHLALAEQAQPKLAGPEQGSWLARLDLERENLLTAHAWAGHADGGAELGLRLANALRPYWLSRGLLMLGHRVTVEALSRIDARSRTQARCRGLWDAGLLCCFMGRYAEAQGYLTESLSIARELNSVTLVAGILQPLVFAYVGQGDLAAARECSEEAVTLARKLGNKRELAAALNGLAQLHRMEGRLDAAQPLYEDVVTLARELGDQYSIAIGLLNLAMVWVGRGLGTQARPLLLEVVEIAERTGSTPAAQSALEVCAGLAAACEDWVGAARFFGAAEAQAKQTGLQRDPVDEAFLAPLIDRSRAALGSTAFATAEAQGRSLSGAEALSQVRAWLGASV
jgi:non-specific serine/threonine protein kinase